VVRYISEHSVVLVTRYVVFISMKSFYWHLFSKWYTTGVNEKIICKWNNKNLQRVRTDFTNM